MSWLKITLIIEGVLGFFLIGWMASQYEGGGGVDEFLAVFVMFGIFLVTAMVTGITVVIFKAFPLLRGGVVPERDKRMIKIAGIMLLLLVVWIVYPRLWIFIANNLPN
ncbi:hypothetical protein A3C18_03200 [Candidatus Kaiserbacteria bacterium RIFCSPHIGHO2_02_FULL_54_11b]|uniref:Uncharacterized protein n=2 Tax=Candidatus Kaiseribacteriota TaxID=1752734 RepID=A0A1F6CR23_9BACT|nr:MAG: hypothetical protein A2704_02490 [Candidatus Kaiserbacteria bacterium RIFCSPHIGHO2_01_FULL_54_36b]OGG63845.1 MAG: hypothetical protein A3C18_03200 [Candidatus Kaiserbacteria bacterium RIFCSPHIGHO2_02_FULL_54_11b]